MPIIPLRRVLPLLHRLQGLGRIAGARRLTNGDEAPASRSDYVKKWERAYKDLDKLDFGKASRILFETPPKRKKFGLDFHLVQLFFACLPSLAVYLVAQYARYEIRRMEAEVEAKKKIKEEEKAKEEKLRAEEGPEAQLLEVKHRLDALEETVKEIAVGKSKIVDSSLSKDQEVSPSSKAGPQSQQTADQSQQTAEESSNSNNPISGSSSPTNVPSQATSKKESSNETDERSSAITKK